jgi:hypothetical protein
MGRDTAQRRYTLRDIFRGYYQPTHDEVEAIWRDGLIVLDANVLLFLYDVQESTATEHLDALKKRESRLWMPYQIAEEFHRNVHKGRSTQTAAHQQRIKKIAGLLGEIRSTPARSRLRATAAQDKAVEALKLLHDELVTERDSIAEQTSHRAPDQLLERIASLFDGKVGAEYPKAKLEALHKEAAKRFADLVPPGYEDAKTKTGSRKYGDYVLWRQLMDHAAKGKQDVLFVTNDNKEDWWLKIEQNSVVPRPELIQEFRAETGQNILILNSTQFYRQLFKDTSDTGRSEKVMAAQQDMEAAVSEAAQDSQPDDVLDGLPPETSSMAAFRAEQARLMTEIEYLTDRKQHIERLLRSLPLDSESRSRLIEQELHPMLERRDLLQERREMLIERLEAYDRQN